MRQVTDPGSVKVRDQAAAGLVEVVETTQSLTMAVEVPELTVEVLQTVQEQEQEQVMTTRQHDPLPVALVPVLGGEDRVEELVWQCCLAVEVLELTAADLAEVLLTV